MNKRTIARAILDIFGINHSLANQWRFGDAFKQQKKLIQKNNPIIFDVGAFDGRTAIHYHKLFPKATIHSFEPFPLSFEKLKASRVNASHLLNNFALSNDTGTVPFYITNAKTCNSLLPSSDLATSVNPGFSQESVTRITTRKLDDYCLENNIHEIDLLKIDVQGAELKVLQGAQQILCEKGIAVLYFETEFDALYKDQPFFDDISLYLRGLGYHFFSMFNFIYLPNGQMVAADAIFIR